MLNRLPPIRKSMTLEREAAAASPAPGCPCGGLEPPRAKCSSLLQRRNGKSARTLARQKTVTSCTAIRSVLSISRSEEHTSELQSPMYLVCRLLLEKKKKK